MNNKELGLKIRTLEIEILGLDQKIIYMNETILGLQERIARLEHNFSAEIWDIRSLVHTIKTGK